MTEQILELLLSKARAFIFTLLVMVIVVPSGIAGFLVWASERDRSAEHEQTAALLKVVNQHQIESKAFFEAQAKRDSAQFAVLYLVCLGLNKEEERRTCRDAISK